MGVVSALALFLLPPSNVNPLPQELRTITFVQGNYLLSNNGQYYPETTTFATLLGNKDPKCPLASQCVSYVRSKIPTLPSGNANQIEPNIEYPVAGGAIIFGGGSYGHIAYIEYLDIVNNRIFISEQNHLGCAIISSRWIDLSAKNIIGYWSP